MIRSRHPFSASRAMKIMRGLTTLVGGIGIRITKASTHWLVTRTGESIWRHPWWMTPRFDVDEERWAVRVKPGFVNENDVFIGDKALTDEEPPSLFMAWRNPMKSAGLIAAPEDSPESVVEAPAEGFPKYFRVYDMTSRQIRACEIILNVPRVATASEVTPKQVVVDQQSLTISSNFVTAHLEPFRPSLKAQSTRFAETVEMTRYDRFLGNAADPLTEPLHMATVWALSPEGEVSDEASPDQGWTLFAEYKVFWNVCRIAKREYPSAPIEPITFRTTLAGGIANNTIAAILAAQNDAAEKTRAFFDTVDFGGVFYTQ